MPTAFSPAVATFTICPPVHSHLRTPRHSHSARWFCRRRTIGSEVDYNSVVLIYSDVNGTHSLAPLFRYELNRAVSQGYSVSSLWQWDLTGLVVSNFSLAFNAAGPSMSFDSLTLDTANQFSAAFPAQPFVLQATPANLARWIYPFNGNPAKPPDGQCVWLTWIKPRLRLARTRNFCWAGTQPTVFQPGQGAKIILSAARALTLTIASGNQYAYSGTLRDYRTYFPTNDPRYLVTTKHRQPGGAFRCGLSRWIRSDQLPAGRALGGEPSSGYYTNRVAYTAGFDTNGILVDVSNNVGDDETNEITSPFEIAPFRRRTDDECCPWSIDARRQSVDLRFEFGRPANLRLFAERIKRRQFKLHGRFTLGASFPARRTTRTFYTILVPSLPRINFPLLDIEGELSRANVDSDGDGLPDDWENFYSGSLINGATNDVDGDGIKRSGRVSGRNNSHERHQRIPTALHTTAGKTSLMFTSRSRPVVNTPSSGRMILQHWQTVTNPAVGIFICVARKDRNELGLSLASLCGMARHQRDKPSNASTASAHS